MGNNLRIKTGRIIGHTMEAVRYREVPCNGSAQDVNFFCGIQRTPAVAYDVQFAKMLAWRRNGLNHINISFVGDCPVGLNVVLRMSKAVNNVFKVMSVSFLLSQQNQLITDKLVGVFNFILRMML